MKITQEMVLRPTENGHVLKTDSTGYPGCKEINLPEQLEALRLMEAVCELQVMIDKEDAKQTTPAG